jgi:STAS domain
MLIEELGRTYLSANGAMMLRVTTYETTGSLIVQLEGKLVGPWVDELEKCFRSRENREDIRAVRFDLTDLSFVDDRGKELLKDFRRRGAELAARGCLMRAIVAELADCSRK